MQQFQIWEKLLLTREKNVENVELPQSIKDVLVRDKCDTDETYNKINVLIKSLYANREELEISEDDIIDLAEYGTTSIIGGDNRDISERLDLAEFLCFNKDFPRGDIVDIIANTYSMTAEYTKELVLNKDFPNEYVGNIHNSCAGVDKDKFRKICFSGEIPYEYMAECLKSSGTSCSSDEFKKAYSALHEELYFDKDLDFQKEYIPDILNNINIGFSEEFGLNKLKLAKILCEDKDFPKDKISDILKYITERGTNTLDGEVVGKFICQRIIPDEFIADTMMAINEYNRDSLECVCDLYSDENIPKENVFNILARLESYDKKTSSAIKRVYKDKDLPDEYKEMIVQNLNYYYERIPKLANMLYQVLKKK